MLHGVGFQKTTIFRNLFLFSTTPLPAVCPTQLSVYCVQLFFDGDQSGQSLNFTNGLSPLSSPKFIFNLSEHDFSTVRFTPSFRWKLTKKESLYDEVMLIPRFVGGKELQAFTACWLVKVPRNTLIPTSVFCKCGYKNTGFDNCRSVKFSRTDVHHGVFVYCDVTSVSKLSLLAFLFFYFRNFSPSQAIYSSIESRAIDGNCFPWFDLN